MIFIEMKKVSIFAPALGEMAEWSNAAVLKTVEGHTSGGSNPSFSAKITRNESCGFFVFTRSQKKFPSVFTIYY